MFDPLSLPEEQIAVHIGESLVRALALACGFNACAATDGTTRPVLARIALAVRDDWLMTEVMPLADQNWRQRLGDAATVRRRLLAAL